MKYSVFLLLCLGIIACELPENSGGEVGSQEDSLRIPSIRSTALVVLGNVQDAGSPHIACQRDCCAALFAHPDPLRLVVALGLLDSITQRRYLFEATPDLPRQMKLLSQLSGSNQSELADGIFLTHAHIGHYAGLMYLGKEAVDAKAIPVFAMPRMRDFLTNNGPWSQLVSRNNVELHSLVAEEALELSPTVHITPILVPHRDEYSETVAYRIEGPNKVALFIPDIDKWDKWERDILAEIREVDYAFLDATFFDAAEVNHRDITQIPHPFVSESLEKFAVLNAAERQKVIFIHFNHTNPLLNPQSEASELVRAQGFRIARMLDVYPL